MEDESGRKILQHELAHIREKHSWDRLFSQLICSIFWMNPFNWIMQKELQNIPNAIGVFLETAHPIKFLDVVEPALGVTLPLPTQIESVMNKEKVSVKISSYEELKAFLNSK